MLKNTRYQHYSVAILYSLTAVLSLALFLFERNGLSEFSVADSPVLLLALLHFSVALRFLFLGRRRHTISSAVKMAQQVRRRNADYENRIDIRKTDFFVHEVLFSLSLIIFLFSYIFALAANMDYVQRFIASGGNLQLALDTRSERIGVLLKYGLYLLAYPFALWMRLLAASGEKVPGRKRIYWRSFFRMMLLILSAVLHALSFPSPLSSNGLGLLAWFSLVPLFVLLRKCRFSRFFFYVLFWMTVSLLIRNYWLGTFSLVSLQVAITILAVYGGLFSLFLWIAERGLRYYEKHHPDKSFLHILFFILIYSSIWTIFDWVQTQGFTAYPWTLIPHSQWRNLALIQISSVTGMWGIGHLVYLVNGVLAAFFCFSGSHRKSWQTLTATVFGLVMLVHGGGAISLLKKATPEARTQALVELSDEGSITTHYRQETKPGENLVRVALVQQNSDPHKHDYEETLNTLMLLSEGIKDAAPGTDLVAWSETAFVPNIARWSEANQDPNHRLVRIVQRMLRYQKTMNTWLLTGNDDYEIQFNSDGSEQERKSYNAAILFSPEGERVDTYHKIRLVPFTEHFPYKDLFPAVYTMLENFDVHFWEPGSERTVFQHPDMAFSTPICFEDSFPDEVRHFVRAGAEVILNISNDYWSLTEVAAKQHFAAALFRAVENRRYLLRSTASGMTAVVNPQGRVILELQSYIPVAAAVDIPVNQDLKTTPYTLLGDYYIMLLFVFLLLCSVGLGVFALKQRS